MTGWRNSIQSGLSGGTGLQNPGYAYDLVGNVTQRQQDTLGLTESFHYDNLCRLDCSQLGSTTNLDLTYGAMGNIISRKVGQMKSDPAVSDQGRRPLLAISDCSVMGLRQLVRTRGSFR